MARLRWIVIEDMMNTTQYPTMRWQAFNNDGLVPDTIAGFDVTGTWDTRRCTTWQNIFLQRNAMILYLLEKVFPEETTVNKIISYSYWLEK